MNVAVACRSAVIVTLHIGVVPEQAPLQPLNVEVPVAAALAAVAEAPEDEEALPSYARQLLEAFSLGEQPVTPPAAPSLAPKAHKLHKKRPPAADKRTSWFGSVRSRLAVLNP